MPMTSRCRWKPSRRLCNDTSPVEVDVREQCWTGGGLERGLGYFESHEVVLPAGQLDV